MPTPPAAAPARLRYLRLLAWAFAAFNAVRVLSYLPTMWAIHQHADSSQHSLWTWLTWFGANATMAAWLYESGGRRCNAAIAVNVCNASMCFFTAALIVLFRL